MTNAISVGRFATIDRCDELLAAGVTDILNVSDTQSQLDDTSPFRSVTWVSIVDRTPIPRDSCIAALGIIHNAVTQTDGHIYVHCMAGWNRSPTIIWLYLTACGVSPNAAAQMICSRAYDAVPGHPLLLDSVLMDWVAKRGRSTFLPHLRPIALETADGG